MNTKGEILRAHYLRLARRLSAWVGVVSIITSMFIPVGALASVGTLSPRKTLISTSSPAVAATTTYTFSFNPSVTNSGATIKAIGFQLCNSPLDLGIGSCTAVSSSSLSAATFTTAGQAAPFNATWAVGTGSDCGVHTSTYVCIFNATGSALSSATNYSIIITGVQNPEVANTEFYTRITTYTAAAAGTPSGETDFGGEALSTGTLLSESATVQESLVFAIGQSGTTCSNVAGGGTVTMSNSTPMGTSTTSKGNAIMCANTNAQTGYVIQYSGTPFAGGGTTFPTVPNNPGFTIATGSQQFGFNMMNNAGSFGAAVSGGVGVCAGASGAYCTIDKYNYDATGTYVTIANTGSAPSADSIYTLSFAADIDVAVKSGVYTATQTFVATGTF